MVVVSTGSIVSPVDKSSWWLLCLLAAVEFTSYLLGVSGKLC